MHATQTCNIELPRVRAQLKAGSGKLQSLVLQAFVLQVFALAVCFAEIFKKKKKKKKKFN